MQIQDLEITGALSESNTVSVSHVVLEVHQGRLVPTNLLRGNDIEAYKIEAQNLSKGFKVGAELLRI